MSVYDISGKDRKLLGKSERLSSFLLSGLISDHGHPFENEPKNAA